MANDAKLVLPTGTDKVTWSDGSNFNGFALAILALPALGAGNYPQPALAAQVPKVRIPTNFPIPIEDGDFEENMKLVKNSRIEPPNTKYTLFFYDVNLALIATGTGDNSLFTVTDDEHEVTPPTLTAPTAATADPAPESGTTGSITNEIIVGNVPIFESPSGTKNGSNTTFTLANDPGGAGLVIVYWNSQPLFAGAGFSRSGTTLTMDVAPAADDVLEALIFQSS